MVNYKATFVQAILAGLCISIGGFIYLSMDDKVVGAFLFSLGLLTICSNGYALFTGKVCFARSFYDIKYLAIIWFGNFLSCIGVGCVARIVKPQLIQKASEICATKLSEGWTVIPLGIMCNILIYFAVREFNTYQDFQRCLIVVMCIMTFILCGFEHCIANMFYFTVSGNISLSYLIINTFGNAVGGILIHQVHVKLF